MRKFGKFLLAMMFPWLVLLLDDNPVGAIIALILQASIIGWIPAIIWARKAQKNNTI